MTFSEEIKLGIPDFLPEPMPYDNTINHAPKRKEILTHEERSLLCAMHYATFPSIYMPIWPPSLSTNSTSMAVYTCTAIVLVTRCMPVR